MLSESTNLPDQNVSLAIVGVDGIGNTVGVVTVARQINVNAEIVGQGLDGVSGASTGAVWKETSQLPALTVLEMPKSKNDLPALGV